MSSIQEANLGDVVGATFEQDLIRTRLKNKTEYLEASWGKLREIIDSVAIDEQWKEYAEHWQTKLTKPQRNSVKSKWTRLVQTFDEQLAAQRNFSVPDEHLRDELRELNTRHVLRPYQIFWDRLHDVDFTTNTQKYLKYKLNKDTKPVMKDTMEYALSQYFES